MVPINFDPIIRADLDQIQLDTHVAVTFHLYRDIAGPVSAYGMRPKETITIETTVIMGPIRHEDRWDGSAIDQSGSYDLIVHTLVDSSGVDLIESEWFSRDNLPSVRIEVGDRWYRVLDKQGHPMLSSKCPYHVLRVAQMMDAEVVV